MKAEVLRERMRRGGKGVAMNREKKTKERRKTQRWRV